MRDKTGVAFSEYDSNEFKRLIAKHPLPWFADWEKADWSVGLPEIPPSVFDSEGELIFEMPEERPSKETKIVWKQAKENWEENHKNVGHSTSYGDKNYCQVCDSYYNGYGSITGEEYWYEGEGIRRLKRAEELVKLINTIAGFPDNLKYFGA